ARVLSRSTMSAVHLRRLACRRACSHWRSLVGRKPSVRFLAPTSAERTLTLRDGSAINLPPSSVVVAAIANLPCLLVVADAADVAGDAGDERHLLRRLVRGRALPHVFHRDHLALARHGHHLAAESDAVDVVDVLDVAADLRRVDMRVHAAVVAGTEHIQVALMEPLR